MEGWHNQHGSIDKKLQHTLNVLHNWGRKTFGIIPKRVKKAEQDLLKLQQTQTNQNTTNQQIQQKEKELDDLLEKEEMWWSQRSRALWLTHGDKNTKYFHQKASHIRKRNKIESIKDSLDQAHTDQEGIENTFINHFKALFTSQTTSNIEATVQVVKNRIDPEMYDCLNMDFTEEEVVTAIRDMKSLAAPGPDGSLPCSTTLIGTLWAMISSGRFYRSLTMEGTQNPIMILTFASFLRLITLLTPMTFALSPFAMLR
jgi:hypothetical protein